MLRDFSILQNTKSIAIGGFDGIHRGHEKLLEEIGEDGVVVVIDKGFSNLTPETKRCDFIKQKCYFMELSNIKEMEGDEFIRLLKEYFPNLEKIVVGYDFRFGKNRAYCANDIIKLFPNKVKIIDEVKIEGISVHSHTIREFLKTGDIKSANLLLGRAYEIEGEIVKGQGIGREKLVPTLNLASNKYLLPKEGVYKTKTCVQNLEWLDSVSFIGKRESTDGNFSIETHIVEKNIEFCPEQVKIRFYNFIRENKKFDSLEELKKQILLDIEEVMKSEKKE